MRKWRAGMRGFALFHKEYLEYSEIYKYIAELIKAEKYELTKLNDYFVALHKSCDNGDDFFPIFEHDHEKYFIYGYITEPEPVDKDKYLEKRMFPKPYFEYIHNSESMFRDIFNYNGSFTLIVVGNEYIKVVSDRFATRPIYYFDSNILKPFISSSGKIILELLKKIKKVRPDYICLASLLLRSRPILNCTIASDIKRTDSGEEIIINNKGLRKSRWVKIKYNIKNKVDEIERLLELKDLLYKSCCNLAKISKSPILFLSGGMDSRLAAALLSNFMKIEAITLCDKLNYEVRIAQNVARDLCLAHKIYYRDKHYYLKNINSYITNTLGNYFYIHGHFSTCLEEIRPGTVYLGDFLESLKKLIGFNNKVIKEIKSPNDLLSKLFDLDEYSSSLRYSTLDVFIKSVRVELETEFRNKIFEVANECFEATKDIALSIDLFLRWSRAYEISTWGMWEDIRLVSSDRNIIWDNNFYNFLLTLNRIERTKSRYNIKLLNIISRKLIDIPDANYFLPPRYNDNYIKLMKYIRKEMGKVRRKILTKMGHPPYSGQHSWQNSDYLNINDPIWKNFIIEKINCSLELENSFNKDFVKKALNNYFSGDFRYSFIIYSLINYAVLFEK